MSWECKNCGASYPEKPKTAEAPKDPDPIGLGKNVLIRTVTHYYTGKVVAITSRYITLSDAAWIADTGRFADAANGEVEFSEIEPYNDPINVFFGAMVDVSAYCRELPREQK